MQPMRNPHSTDRRSPWEYGSENKNVTGAEAEIVGKRASHEDFLQLRELFYDQHGDYQIRDLHEIWLWGWTDHEIKIDEL
jgi:hypothetical protein